MRQRNVKKKKEIIQNSISIVHNPQEYKGRWHELFKNNNPIYLEIGMGKGNFLLENAIRNPNINYIGIEKYDSIMALAIKKIDLNPLNNIKLIRFDALEIDKIFHHEIDLLYLNFSDPWPKPRHEKRRLTSFNFLKKYDDIFNINNIEMKTDNRELFEYSLISFINFGYKIKCINLDLHKSNIGDIINLKKKIHIY